MSGIMQMLMAGGGVQVVNPLTSGVNSVESVGEAFSTVTTFNSDGTIVYANSSEGSPTVTQSGPNFWAAPAGAGVGDSFWISVDGGAWQSLSADRYVGYAFVDAYNGWVEDYSNIRIATDSGGSNIVLTSNGWLTRSYS